jgi:RIO-like serine/threonine protein kinase
MALNLTRDQLADATVRVVHPARGLRPDVRVIRCNGRLAVLKDYFECPGLRREFLGRWLARREYWAYCQVDGVQGVPKPLGMLDPYAFACEYVEATCGSKFGPGELPAEFFARFRALVETIHQHGIAHGDLKRRRNILVDHELRPYLIDFASAVPRRPGWDVFGNGLFRQLCQIDLNAIAKLKRRVSPQWLTQDEERNLQFPTFLERWAKRVLGR